MKSKKNILHIEIRELGIYVNNEDYFSFEKTNLRKDIVLFSSKRRFPLKCRMNAYDLEKGKLSLEIVNYQHHDIEKFNNQSAKLPISSIVILNIQFELLKPLLVFYNKDKLKLFLAEDSFIEEDEMEAVIHEISLKVNLSKLKFLNGKVCFKHSLTWYKESTVLEIENVNLLKDYEYIKFYFAKLFGRKSIDVYVECSSNRNGIKLIRCKSPQIDSIKRDTVKILKTYIYSDLTKNKQHIKQGSLLTIDELLSMDLNEDFGNIDVSEKELLFTLIKDKNVRNVKELAYLANVIQHKHAPIFINLNPKIGFVFVFNGETLNHFIWELLNSNATYIWGVSKKYDIKKAIKVIEKEISLIKYIGRTTYKQEHKNTSSMYFNYLIHKSSKSEIDDPFPMWIAKLHELLI